MIIVVGADVHSCPLAVRERLTVPEENVPVLARYLMDHAGIKGVMVLSTCGRTEFYLDLPPTLAPGEVRDHIARYLIPNEEQRGAFGLSTDRSAVRHLARVAAGLESRLVGESQILGQVRRAHQVAATSGTLSPSLDRAIRGAITIGKRARTDTPLGQANSGVAEWALHVARDRFTSLDGVSLGIVGAGAMGRRIAHEAQALGADVTFFVRHSASAEGFRWADSATLATSAAHCDVLMTATSSPHVVVTREVGCALQQQRGWRPLLIVDLAVPRDVDPVVGSLGGIELLDVDSVGSEGDLDHIVGLSQATALVDREAATLVASLEARAKTTPALAALFERAEQLRLTEIERSFGETAELSSQMRERIDVMTKSLVRKLLHNPASYLRQHAAESGHEGAEVVIEALGVRDPAPSVMGEAVSAIPSSSIL